MTNIPTEEQEQISLVRYLQIKNIPHFRVPNETYTKSWKQKIKNKQLGVVKGIPDIFVIINNRLIAIELKRIKNSVTSPKQLLWVELLNSVGVSAKICKGYVEAIAFIESFNERDTSGTTKQSEQAF